MHERDLYLLVYSHSGHNGLSCDGLKLGARSFSRVSIWVQGPVALGHPTLISQVLSRELD